MDMLHATCKYLKSERLGEDDVGRAELAVAVGLDVCIESEKATRCVSEVRGMQLGMGGVLRASTCIMKTTVESARNLHGTHMASRTRVIALTSRRAWWVIAQVRPASAQHHEADANEVQLSAHGTGTVWLFVHLVVAHADVGRVVSGRRGRSSCRACRA